MNYELEIERVAKRSLVAGYRQAINDITANRNKPYGAVLDAMWDFSENEFFAWAEDGNRYLENPPKFKTK